MLVEAERAAARPSVVVRRLQARERLPGYGHKIYVGDDPRLAPLLELVRELPDPHGRLDVVEDVLVETGVRMTKRPNVDLGLGALTFVAGLPGDIEPFAVARIAGFAAHLQEELRGAPGALPRHRPATRLTRTRRGPGRRSHVRRGPGPTSVGQAGEVGGRDLVDLLAGVEHGAAVVDLGRGRRATAWSWATPATMFSPSIRTLSPAPPSSMSVPVRRAARRRRRSPRSTSLPARRWPTSSPSPRSTVRPIELAARPERRRTSSPASALTTRRSFAALAPTHRRTARSPGPATLDGAVRACGHDDVVAVRGVDGDRVGRRVVGAASRPGYARSVSIGASGRCR